jgi:hypothetical protein
MSRYVVTFFKHLVDSEGRPFKTTQAKVELDSGSPQQAVARAVARFAEARHVHDWTLHADGLELSARERRAASEQTCPSIPLPS